LLGGEIINCTNLAEITSSTYYDPSEYTGGIVGYATGGISYCINNGNIFGGRHVGGIVGYIEVTNNFLYCGNSGKISGRITNLNTNHETYMGGIAGYIKGVVSCTDNTIFTNIGHVDGYNPGSMLGHHYGYVGGIAGYLESSMLSLCVNAGMVDGFRLYVGGIAGYVDNFSGVGYCINTNKITHSDTTNYGAIVGNRGRVDSCFYDNQMSGIDDISAIGLPTDSMLGDNL